jgi:hypothetical protein
MCSATCSLEQLFAGCRIQTNSRTLSLIVARPEYAFMGGKIAWRTMQEASLGFQTSARKTWSMRRATRRSVPWPGEWGSVAVCQHWADDHQIAALLNAKADANAVEAHVSFLGGRGKELKRPIYVAQGNLGYSQTALQKKL